MKSNYRKLYITSNEELQEVGGWQISDDKKVLTKTYTKNNEELITIYDLAGNSITETIKVENIDKEKLEYEIEYSTTITTNQDVTVTITANKEIQGVEGWILLEDKKTLIKTYTENAEEEITIKDLVGNSITAKIKISNIDKTISEMILPNTGEKIIFLHIVIFFILCIFGGIKLKKYKDIKKLYR